MQTTVRQHRGNVGGVFSAYDIVSVKRVENRQLWERYSYRRGVVAENNNGDAGERMLFHGSRFVPRRASLGGAGGRAW